jgi:crotonobetainyl-CoA:carnitine CoA-transferase CaiB-like acyl-CoA transferase
MVPFQNFRSADGWLVVACPKQSLWERLCGAIGRPELAAADGSYATFADRARNRDELLAELDAVFVSRPTAEWLETLTEAGVPCAPVNDVAAALADPQTVARAAIVEHEHPVLGDVRQVGSPFVIDGARPESRPGPGRGSDTGAVLGDLCGYSDEQIRELADRGVFGDVAVDAR